MANRAGKVQVGEAGERGRISLWLAYGVASGLTSLSLYQRRASHLRHGISFAVMKGSAGVLATAAWFPTASGPQGKEEGFLFFLAVDKHMNGVINCCSIFGPDVYDDKPLASAFLVRRYDTTGIQKNATSERTKDRKKSNSNHHDIFGGHHRKSGHKHRAHHHHIWNYRHKTWLGKGRDDTKQSTGAFFYTHHRQKGFALTVGFIPFGLDGFSFGHGRYPAPSTLFTPYSHHHASLSCSFVVFVFLFL